MGEQSLGELARNSELPEELQIQQAPIAYYTEAMLALLKYQKRYLNPELFPVFIDGIKELICTELDNLK